SVSARSSRPHFLTTSGKFFVLGGSAVNSGDRCTSIQLFKPHTAPVDANSRQPILAWMRREKEGGHGILVQRFELPITCAQAISAA
ncbi:unnamed protein product, partial [Mycena citricolor]